MEHKRHSAIKNTTRKSTSVGTAIVAVISIVLIVGIIVLSPIGTYIMDHWISPLIYTDKNTKDDNGIVSALKQQETEQASASPSIQPTEKSHQVLTVEETPFYILQMGAFTNKEDAYEHANEIMRMGAGGAVYQDGSVYRVFAAAYSDELSLQKVQSQVRNDGFEATPYITESRGLKITLEGNRDAVVYVTEAIQLMNRIPSDLCNLCLSYDSGKTDITSLYGELEKYHAACKTVLDELKQVNTEDTKALIDLLQKYMQNISTFLDEHDTINTEMVSGELKHLQLSVIIDYISYFDRK